VQTINMSEVGDIPNEGNDRNDRNESNQELEAIDVERQVAQPKNKSVSKWAAFALVLLGLLLLGIVIVALMNSRQTTSGSGTSTGTDDGGSPAPFQGLSGSDKRQLLVIRNFNSESGLFWKVYCVMCAAFAARKHNLRLVVLFDSGLYYETDKKHLHANRDFVDVTHNEWFSYYFEPLGANQADIQKVWHSGALDRLPSFAQFKPGGGAFRLNRRSKGTLGWVFDRSAFDKRDMMGLDFGQEWKRTIVLKPYLREQVEAFWSEHQLDDPTTFVIGAHIRGTDKYGDAHDNEDGPKHFEYSDYCRALSREVDKQRKTHPEITTFALLACSDEQPFIDFFHDWFSEDKQDGGQQQHKKLQAIDLTSRGSASALKGSRFFSGAMAADRSLSSDSRPTRVVAVSTGNRVLRSPVSTSGLQLKSHLCRGGPAGDLHPDCAKYRELAKQSIHRGFADHSKFKKGWDAVFEVSLLAKCRVFYKSRGNFSNAVVYANPGITSIDMVSTL
jgi:hypothetical protein